MDARKAPLSAGQLSSEKKQDLKKRIALRPRPMIFDSILFTGLKFN
jgi:hypothetical protein